MTRIFHLFECISLINCIFKKWLRRSPKQDASTPDHIIPRSKHSISRSNISPNTVKVLYKLKEAGYSAFLVGGGVRDILLGKKPKDFDVATNAHPEMIRAIFRNSRIIGRRFRLVHVFFGDEIIEVSTFRANTSEETRSETVVHADTGMIARDNTYGTIEEDAWRRDFTVNALYYNIADFSVVDYMHGMRDLKNRQLRMIGDPSQRFHEDPVRLLRAIRLSAKLDFTIEAETEKALQSLPDLLQHVAPARLFDECLKLFFEGNAEVTYRRLNQYHYLKKLFPQMIHALHAHKDKNNEKLIELALKATDKRFKSGDSTNPGFLFSVFLWPVLQMQIAQMKNKKNKFYFRLHHFVHEIIQKQLEAVMITKRFQFVMQSVWMLQFQLTRSRPNRVMIIFNNRYFRAAFDFMLLRFESGETQLLPHIEWWRAFQLENEAGQQKMIEALRSS